MDNLLLIIFFCLFGLVAYYCYRKSVIPIREQLIDTFRFPNTIPEKIIEKYPHLSEQEASQVMDGLWEYFHLCNVSGRRMVSMPSQAVDLAWHEFILFTRKYDRFCNKTLGRFLHHTPAEAMVSQTVAQSGIKTAWKISCRREDISSKTPHKLPLLFAMDASLKIPGGFKYSLNCTALGGHDYCAGHISAGFGCGGGCSGDTSGCGGGCGG